MSQKDKMKWSNRKWLKLKWKEADWSIRPSHIQRIEHRVKLSYRPRDRRNPVRTFYYRLWLDIEGEEFSLYIEKDHSKENYLAISAWLEEGDVYIPPTVVSPEEEDEEWEEWSLALRALAEKEGESHE